MNENKKLLDLTGLQRYDGKIKQYVEDSIDAITVTSITDEEIGDLFEEGLLNQKYVSQDSIQTAINTEY